VTNGRKYIFLIVSRTNNVNADLESSVLNTHEDVDMHRNVEPINLLNLDFVISYM